MRVRCCAPGLILALWPALALAAPTPAFPGAEGFAANTPGGRGGLVHVVRNLCDYRPFMILDGASWSSSPPDAFECTSVGTRPDETLRWGLEELTGPRTIVFAVGGTIYTRNDLRIEDGSGQVTIAGQTAPAPGITLAAWYEEASGMGGAATTSSTPLEIAGQDVILRHLRVRPGPGCEIALTLPPLAASVSDAECTGCEPGCDPLCGTRAQYAPGFSPLYPECRETGHDALALEESAARVMIDHVSFSWGVDEVVSAFYGHDLTFTDGTVPTDITIQHSIVSQGLVRSVHPKGVSHSMAALLQANRVSLHHNYFAYNMNRNPQVLIDGPMEFVSNVVYGFGFNAGRLIVRDDPGGWVSGRFDFAHNYYHRGNAVTNGEDYSALVNASRFSQEYDPGNPTSNPGHILNVTWDDPFADFDAPDPAYTLYSASNAFINAFSSVDPDRFTGQSDDEVDFPFCVDDLGLTEFSTSAPWCDGLQSSVGATAVADATSSTLAGEAGRVPVTLTPVSGLPAVLSDVGATLPARDAVDADMVDLALLGGAFDPDPANGGFVDQPAQYFCSGATSCGASTPDRWWPDAVLVPAYVDLDADGMDDQWEIDESVSDPNADGDLDGYTNLEEFLNGTLPDVCDFDSDADGACEVADNCPDVANASQADWNGNGVGNACEPTQIPAFGGAIGWRLLVMGATGLAGALALRRARA